MSGLDKAFFAQIREAAVLSRKHSKHQILGKLIEAQHELVKFQPPTKLSEMLRLQDPELVKQVRQDWQEPGMPKNHVVIDDGPCAGFSVAICRLEADAALIVEMWNWIRTLKP